MKSGYLEPKYRIEFIKSNYTGIKFFSFEPKGETKENYVQHDYKNIDAFLDSLAHRSNLLELSTKKKEQFLFRGHKNYSWVLEPSFYRKLRLGEENFINESFPIREMQLYYSFVEEANKLGIQVEFEALENAKGFNNNGIFDTQAHLDKLLKWPSKKDYRVLGLAQHYGVRTRLLDWTRNALTAVFFAATEAFNDIKPKEKITEDKKIGIWIIPEVIFHIARIVNIAELIEIPTHQNENIRAQDGLFSIHFFSMNNYDMSEDFYKNLVLSNYDLLKILYEKRDGVEDEYFNFITETDAIPRLLTLPYEMVPELILKLKRYNISWTRLIPSLEGVKKQVELELKLQSYS